ncbi:MAG: hypothetical protein E4H20_11320, partial [Spirochaetales bacterium]
MSDSGNGNLVVRRASSLRSARILATIIFIGGLAASLGGLVLRAPQGYALGPAASVGGQAAHPTFMSLFGQEVSLDGEGIYRRDSVSGAAQERAQDLVTLLFGLPLLAAGFVLSGRGSLGGKLLLSGGLGYFLYCYGMMSVGTAYNEFFLLYVALFAAALYGFIFSIYAIDADQLAVACEQRYPRRSAIALCIAIGFFLGLTWLGKIVLPSLASGLAPSGIDASSTLFVQAFDLGILVPVAALSAFWLIKRDRRGYLAGTVLLVKGSAEGLAVVAMGFNMLRVGVTESLPMILSFLVLALCAFAIGARAVWSAGLRT